jgi:uncharacterized membrane protein
MRYSKWIGLLAAIVYIGCCFFPWVIIESKHIEVTGLKSEGTNFGSPGYLGIVLSVLFIIFNFTPRIWAKRMNLAVVALQVGWAVRNYYILSVCRIECPEKQTGLYLQLVAALIMLAVALFPDMKIPRGKQVNR